MKTVRDACQLQPNALSVKLSDQIEQLDELISAEGNFGRTDVRAAWHVVRAAISTRQRRCPCPADCSSVHRRSERRLRLP